MERPITVVWFLLVLLLQGSTSLWAQKIEVDPNTPEATAEKAIERAGVTAHDERLLQKITYTATDKRLGAVLEELSSVSSVAVRCGKNKNDWQVQDIPIVVCVRDMELGKLLESIAESAHLTLTATVVNGVTLYRIWRSPDIEKMMVDYPNAVKAYSLARVNQEWDFWQKIGSMPQSEWEKVVSKPDDTDAQFANLGVDVGLRNASARSFAQLLASAPPDTKAKILAGERVKWAVSDLSKPMADCVESIMRNDCQQQRYYAEKYAREHPDIIPFAPEFKAEDVRKSRIEIWMDQSSMPRLASSLVTPTSSGAPAVQIPSSMFRELTKERPLPKFPEQPQTQYSPNLKFVQPFSSVDTPLLQTKIRIEKPKDRTDLRFRDLLALFAEAAGYSIVCEDFRSHDTYCPANHSADVFDREITIKEFLTKISSGLNWYFDEEGKLIVASSYSWCTEHANLAPASLVDYVNTKMNGDGVYLDDMLPLLQLTKGQYSAWFQNAYGISFPPAIEGSFNTANPFWPFYASLLPEDKELAKSAQGIPLGKFDPQYIGGLLKSTMKCREEIPAIGEDGWTDAFETMGQADMLPRLTMKLVREEVGSRFTVVEQRSDGGFSTSTDTGPQGIPRHRWNILVSGPDTGVAPVAQSTTFPIYSTKREAEIMAERQKSAVKDGDKASKSTQEPK